MLPTGCFKLLEKPLVEICFHPTRHEILWNPENILIVVMFIANITFEQENTIMFVTNISSQFFMTVTKMSRYNTELLPYRP